MLADSRGSKLLTMRVEIGRQLDEAAVFLQQVMEVDRSLLAIGKLGCQQGQDRSSDDAGLELRARIQADDGRAVIDRSSSVWSALIDAGIAT